MGRYTTLVCDRCKREFPSPVCLGSPVEWPVQCKIEVPLKASGMVFTRTKDLCLPCRQVLIDAFKEVVEWTHDDSRP
jgi:hypothetical protein